MKRYEQKKVSRFGAMLHFGAVFHVVPYGVRKLAHAIKVASISLLDILRYPLVLTFKALLPLQLMCMLVAFGFFAMMGYVAIIAFTLVTIIKKREDNNFKCLYGQNA